VIVDVEVSNRSLVQMRQDMFRYFAEPTVYSVVRIRMFPTGKVLLFFFILFCSLKTILCAGQLPAARAVAVQWSRQGAGQPIVTAVVDFGYLPISADVRSCFAAPSQSGDISRPAAVDPALWVQNRCTPVPAAMVTPEDAEDGKELTGDAILYAAAAFVHHLFPPHARDTLYPTAKPSIIFSGEVLTTLLHNLPPHTPMLTDFVMDLAKIFYAVAGNIRTVDL